MELFTEEELEVVRTRHGSAPRLYYPEFRGKRFNLIIECPCGRGESGPLTVQCPEERIDPLTPQVVWGLCYACEERVEARIHMYDVIEVDPVCFIEEAERAIESAHRVYAEAWAAWKRRPVWRVLLDWVYKKKFVPPSSSDWGAWNNIRVDGMVNLEVAVSVRCPHCKFGRTITEFLRAWPTGFQRVGGKCMVCDKEVVADVHLYQYF